jgi:hypothetical protein
VRGARALCACLWFDGPRWEARESQGEEGFSVPKKTPLKIREEKVKDLKKEPREK